MLHQAPQRLKLLPAPRTVIVVRPLHISPGRPPAIRDHARVRLHLRPAPPRQHIVRRPARLLLPLARRARARLEVEDRMRRRAVLPPAAGARRAARHVRLRVLREAVRRLEAAPADAARVRVGGGRVLRERARGAELARAVVAVERVHGGVVLVERALRLEGAVAGGAAVVGVALVGVAVAVRRGGAVVAHGGGRGRRG